MYHYSKKGPSHPTRVILGLIYMARDERDKTFRDQAKLSRRSSPCNLARSHVKSWTRACSPLCKKNFEQKLVATLTAPRSNTETQAT